MIILVWTLVSSYQEPGKLGQYQVTAQFLHKELTSLGMSPRTTGDRHESVTGPDNLGERRSSVREDVRPFEFYCVTVSGHCSVLIISRKYFKVKKANINQDKNTAKNCN